MNYFEKLEEIISENLNSRGMDKVYLFGEIENAAIELVKADTIIIATGFVIKDKLAGETDGPLGAISIANALNKLGKNISIVTDVYSKEMLEDAMRLVNLKCPLEILIKGDEVNFSKGILSKYKPDCLISVERPGEASDGKIYSMRGECLSDIIPSMDQLFIEAKMQRISTIGIGDGGNEIGMGKIKQYVVENIPNGNIISASFATDHLILAGVSNWGAHALVAAISLLLQEDLLYNNETEVQSLKTIVNAGAVDGLTKERTLTVDGISLEDNIRIFDTIKLTIENWLSLEKGAS
jgi:hypothetical protein